MASLRDNQPKSLVPKPHAVLFPMPAQGHINPLMHLSMHLAAKGFTVTFVNLEHQHNRLLQSQAQADDAAPEQHKGLDIHLLSIPDGLPPSHDRNLFDLVAALKDVVGAFFEDLLEKLMQQDPPPTCIITDLYIPFAPDVANKFRLPWVAFWTQNAVSYACHVMFSKGFRASEAVPGASNHITIPGAPPLQFTDMPSLLQSCDPTDLLFEVSVTPFKRVGEAAFVLINTSAELEEVAMQALRKEQELYSVGPLLPPDFLGVSGNILQSERIGTSLWPEDYGCLQWLDARPPSSVLYVSFGSIAVMSTQQLHEFALGLEASQQTFLWVVRPDLVHGSDSSIFPEGYLDRLEDRALFVSWAPQLQVLSHPSVGGFLTHYGWNSILESISRGVPMLGWPYFADQMLDCRLTVDQWRAGLDFEVDGSTGTVSRIEVEKKVRALMEGNSRKELRERAAELQDEARRAMMEGGSSRRNLELFVKELLGCDKGLLSSNVELISEVEPILTSMPGLEVRG